MDKATAENICKQPHEFDPISGTYKLLTKEPNPFYPKAKYMASPDEKTGYLSMTVLTKEEEAELGPEWVDHPNLLKKPRAGEAADGGVTLSPAEADAFADYLKWKNAPRAIGEVIRQTESDLKATTGVFDSSLKKRRGRPPKAADSTNPE